MFLRMGLLQNIVQESVKTEKLLEFFDTYSTVINAGLTFVTILVSLATVIVTFVSAKSARKDAKEALEEQKRQFEESLKSQAEQYKEDRKHSHEIERIHEQPYLLFSQSQSEIDSRHNCVDLCIEFVNKGRGTAYDIFFEHSYKAETVPAEKLFELSQKPFNKSPIAMINEPYRTQWQYKGEKEKKFHVIISMQYKDASGRQYKQVFGLAFVDGRKGSLVSATSPELCDEESRPTCD